MLYKTVGSLLMLALALLVRPLLTDAQRPTTVPRLGVLLPQLPTARVPFDAGFLQGLRDLGYREGDTLHIDYRFAALQYDRFPTLAAELVALQPDVIFVGHPLGVRAAQQATTTIPIVVMGGGDLLAQGFIASQARPGGNITGLTSHTGHYAKRLELLKEAVPTITRVALLFDPVNTMSELHMKGAFEADAHALER